MQMRVDECQVPCAKQLHTAPWTKGASSFWTDSILSFYSTFLRLSLNLIRYILPKLCGSMLARNDMLSTGNNRAPRARRSCYVDKPAYGLKIPSALLSCMPTFLSYPVHASFVLFP